jgi:HK97 family phage major capsid protein
MNAETLVKQIDLALTEVRAIQAKYTDSEMPKDVSDDLNARLDKIDQMKVSLELDRRARANENFLNESQGTKGAQFHGFREAAEDEGNAPIDPQAWRSMEVRMGRGRNAEVVEVRYHVPLNVQDPNYKSAFESYLVKGRHDMGGNDKKTLYEGLDSAGGYLVPEDYQAQMIRKIMTMAVVRQYARVITTSSDRVSFPSLKYTTDDNYTSSVRLVWTGEQPASASVHRATTSDYGLTTIPVHTAMSSIPVTMDLLMDSVFDLESHIAGMFGEAFALGEEAAFWTGDGAGQPMGILHDVDGTNGVASVNSGSASTLTADGLINLTYEVPTQYEMNARVFWRKATEKVVRTLVNSTTDDYLWPAVAQVGAFGGVERSIEGYPISRAEFVPAIAGDDFPIVFGDLQGYYIADRVGISIQRLDEVYAEQNLVAFLAKKRVGGQLAEPWRIKAQKISNS